MMLTKMMLSKMMLTKNRFIKRLIIFNGFQQFLFFLLIIDRIEMEFTFSEYQNTKSKILEEFKKCPEWNNQDMNSDEFN